MTTPVDIYGRLVADCNGGELILTADGRRIECSLRSKKVTHFLRSHFPSRRARQNILKRFAHCLRQADLDLVVTYGDKVVGHMGQSTPPNLLSRILGLSPMRVDFFALLRLLFGKD